MRVHPATSHDSRVERHPLDMNCNALRRGKTCAQKRWKWKTGLPPSKTSVKLVARRLGQTERGIRQTESTTANSPCNFPIQKGITRQSRHHHQTVQRTVLQQWCRHYASLPFQHTIGDDVMSSGPDYARTYFPSTQENPPQPIGPGVVCVCVCVCC